MSALMARDKGFMPWLIRSKFILREMQKHDEMFKAASELSTLIDRSPYVSDTKNSAFHTRLGVTTRWTPGHEVNLGFQQLLSMILPFDESKNDTDGDIPEVNRQIAEPRHSFPRTSLNSGKLGHISIGLAREFPELRFIVQDISTKMLFQAQEDIIPCLGGRVTFQQHSFFEPQPVHDANPFLLRLCLHNYNDPDYILIIRALVPALEKCNADTAFLINSIILPKSGSTTRYVDHHLRQADLSIMVTLGAK